MREQALAEAAEADREIAAGRYRGPLHGIPITVKDLVDVRGTPTTAGSKVPGARSHRPTRRSSAACAKPARSSSARPTCTNSRSGRPATRPPSAPSTTRSIGRGPQAAPAAAPPPPSLTGMGFASVGTDTGGSIRIPAAACGIVGLKPTFGELPCAGVVPLSTTLDHVGPLARSVADASLMFQAMKSSSVHGIAPAGGALTFGVPRQYFFDRLDPGVRAVGRPRHRAGHRRRLQLSATRRSAAPSTRPTSTCTSACPKPRAITPQR